MDEGGAQGRVEALFAELLEYPRSGLIAVVRVCVMELARAGRDEAAASLRQFQGTLQETPLHRLEEIYTATFDLDAVRSYRERWSVFRDRRPELYGTLLTLGGETASA